MKKIFALIFASIIFVTSLSAAWFDDRFFELAVDLPFGLSNNSIKIGDILKEDLVIDLREIAEKMPEEGLSFYMYSNPSLSFRLRIKNFTFGGKSGVEGFGSAAISKDLFDYLGKGNYFGQTLNISQNVNSDVFAVQEFFASFNVKRFKVTVRPAVFFPFFHITSNNGNLRIENDEEGNLKVNYKSSLEVYSALDYKKGKVSFSPGFDIATSLTYPLFDFLSLTGNLRFPVFPGQLGYKFSVDTEMNFETSADKIISGDLGSRNFDSEVSSASSASYTINRPLKFSLFADFTPFGDWVLFTGGLGMGFRHPFTDDKDSFEVFGEYYLGGKIMLGNILSAGLSSQYYEKLFIHQIDFKANVRIFELDFGISSQSSDFLKSCSGGGIGSFITVRMGF